MQDCDFVPKQENVHVVHSKLQQYTIDKLKNQQILPINII